MLKEFVDAIGALANQAQGPLVVKPDGEPDYVYWLCEDGNSLRIEATPDPRRHQAASLETIVAFAKRMREDHLGLEENGDETTTVVWYSRTAVECICHDKTRRDRVTLALQLSDQILCLKQMQANRRGWKQKELISLLRVTFSTCLGRADNLLELLRKIRFLTSAAGESTVVHGKASIGRQIEAEMQGVGVLPEYVTLDVPIFGAILTTWQNTVVCALEIFPETETLQLIPLPGEIENAIASGEQRLGELLAADLDGDGIPVYHGVP